MQKKKMLIFHQALASYRIDQFNSLNELFDLEVVFLYDNLADFKLNQNSLMKQCNFRISFLLHGPKYKVRLFRFGVLNKIRQLKPNIVLGYEYSLTTQYLLLLRRLGIIRQKIGTTVDDSLDICHNVQSKTREYLRKQSVKQLDFLVVMSKEVSTFYQEKFNLNDTQIIVSPILQLPERLRRDEETIEAVAKTYIEKYQLREKKILLFVGRFVHEKALPLFLETASHELQKRDDVRFVLVGEGPEIEPIQAIANQYRLNDRIIFPGRYEGNELYGWYAIASGFVLPSLSETFGAVVNEALIFGVKVLCSQYAGASCLINSDNGIVFDPKDKRDAETKISLFLDELKAVNKISMVDKPPLIEDYMTRFTYEWNKLLNN